MAKRIGVFIDVRDVYNHVVKRYGKGRKLNYYKYLQWVLDVGEIQVANAYGIQIDNEADIFISRLKQLGINCKFHRTENTHNFSWDCGLTVDVLSVSDKLDMVVLGCSTKNFRPLIKYLRDKGITVVVLACGISQYLKEVVTRFVEIPESMLEIKNEIDNATETNLSSGECSDATGQTSGDNP